MKNRFFSFCLLVCLLLGSCGCAETPAPPTDTAGVIEQPRYDLHKAAQIRDDRYVYLTVWSWQIPDKAAAEAMAQAAKDAGFTAVDLGVLWARFEPEQGAFDWTWLDETAETFRAAGFPLSVQPLLWTKDLAWAENLVLQALPDGSVSQTEERGATVSLADAGNRTVLRNTLTAFFEHASRTYGEFLTRWGVRLSAFGEFDYSIGAPVDCSAPARAGFFDALEKQYETYDALSAAAEEPVEDRKALEALDFSHVTQIFSNEWRRFRQDVLTSFAALCGEIMRTADHSVPVVLSPGTFGNGINAAYSGWIDFRRAVEQADCDIIGVAFCDGTDDSFLLSLAAGLGKEISVEVDGAWALAEGRDVPAQVELCGRFGTFSLSTANFTLAQLQEHKDTLSRYRDLFFTDGTMGDPDPSMGILLITDALISEEGDAYAAWIGDAFAALSDNGAKRVNLFTDGQIAAKGAACLAGIETLDLGRQDGDLLPSAVAEILREAGVSLVSTGAPDPEDPGTDTEDPADPTDETTDVPSDN